MVKHKMTRRYIEEYFKIEDVVSAFDIEDYIADKTRYVPSIHAIVGILTRDPKYERAGEKIRHNIHGSTFSIKLWRKKEVLDDSESNKER